MNAPFDAGQLGDRLSELPVQAAFGLGILALERALPGYYKFLADNGLRDRDRLREMSAEFWRTLEGNSSRHLSLTPDWDGVIDSESYTSIFTTSAIDAIGIAYELHEFIDNQNLDHIINCCSMRVDTIDLFLQNSGVTAVDLDTLNQAISHHPLMQNELEFQRLDYAAMKEAKSLSANIWISALRRSVEGRYLELKLGLTG